MTKILAFLLCVVCAFPALAQGVTPQQAKNLANTLQDDQKRAALISQLNTLAAVAPAKPALDPAALGENLLQAAADQLDHASDQLVRSLGALDQLPLVGRWARRLIDNPWARGRAGEVLGKLAGLIVIAGLVAWGARRGTQTLLHRLALLVPFDPVHDQFADPVAEAEAGATEAMPRHGRLWYLLRLLPFVALRLLLDLVPVAVFVGAGYFLLGTVLGQPHITRLVCLAAMTVLAAARVVWCVARMLASPDEPRLRLFAISNAGAVALVRWTGWITFVAVTGIVFTSSAGLLGLPDQAVNAVQKLVALVVHLMLMAAVLRSAKPVARRIRAPRGSRGPIAAMRDWLAVVWVPVALVTLATTWFVWAIELDEGPTRLLQIVGASLLVMIIARLIAILGLGALERVVDLPPEYAYRLPGIDKRIRRYAGIVRVAFRLVLAVTSILLLFHLWGWDVGRWFDVDGWGRGALSASGTILVALLLGAVVWEASVFAIQRHFDHLTEIDAVDRLIRLRTIEPILRTCLLTALALVLGMVILSQLGINIAPLLAGAGIAGIAIGFGAQKLVQDVITGLFLLLDNAVQVGDGITAAGLTGTVEHLSLRCLRLRASDGALHFIPFSAVTAVTNNNRGRAVAALRFEFDAHADVALVGNVLQQVACALRADEKFAGLILDDLKLLGIEEMTGDKLVISAQLACLTAGRAAVIYEFRRLLLLALSDHHIELAGTGPAVQVFAAPMPAATPMTSSGPQAQGAPNQESGLHAAIV